MRPCRNWLCCKPVEEVGVVKQGKGTASSFCAVQTVLYPCHGLGENARSDAKGALDDSRLAHDAALEGEDPGLGPCVVLA